jgi:hypothetical protein
MNDVGAAVIVVLVMSGIYVFILRGSRRSKGPSQYFVKKVAGDGKGPEFVTGLLATFCLATLPLGAGAAESMMAGGLMAVLAAVCTMMPTTVVKMVRLPIHFLYSVLGILGAFGAATKFLFPPDPEPSELWKRWALLALVWSFAVFGAIVGFLWGRTEWKLGLLLFAWAELLIYTAGPLESSQPGVWMFLLSLIGAIFFGFVSSLYQQLLEFTAATVMTLGTLALLGLSSKVPGAEGFIQATGPTILLIMTFLGVFAILRAVLGRVLKAIPF